MAYGVPEGDYNARLTILGSFFVASLALRYISVQYLPHVSYATALDWYIQACLFFTLAGVVETVSAYAFFFPILNIPLYISAPQADGTTLNYYPPVPSPKLHTNFDSYAWLALAVLWALTNAYFVVHFIHSHVDYRALQARQEGLITRRRNLVLGLHPARAAEREEAAARVTCWQLADAAGKQCCRSKGYQQALVNLGHTLAVLGRSCCQLLLLLPRLLDALLLCRAGAHCLEQLCRAVRHHNHYHLGHLRGGLPQWKGKSIPYDLHEQPRLYGLSTRKNRNA